MVLELHPHQINAIKEMHNGCIVKGGVGTGKSRTAIGYFYLREIQGSIRINGAGYESLPKTPRDLYVITTARKRDSLDWEGEAAKWGLSSQRDSSICDIQVKVDSWNNIKAYEEVKDAFFIFDEQRLVGSGAWVKAFINIAKQNRWVMLSATPGDNWMDYVPVFIANGYYKNRTEFIRRHVVFSRFSKFPKVDRYVEQSHLDKLRERVVVDMPYARHTKRHVQNVLVPHDVELFRRVWVDRWHVYDDRPIKDVAELFRVARKVVNSDVGRIGDLMKLVEKHPKLIVFYNFDYELEILRVLGGTLGVETAEWNGHKHQEVPTSDKWLYLVQYAAGNEAWNCVETDAIAFWSLNYSYKVTEQAKGRIDRMNTPFVDLYYYMFRSDSQVDRAIIKALAQKKKFNEKDLIKEL